MNRDTARAIERQALALLAPLESAGQLKVAVKGGTIGKTFVNLKIEFAESAKMVSPSPGRRRTSRPWRSSTEPGRQRLGKAVRQPRRAI